MTNPNREAQIEAGAKALFDRDERRELERYPYSSLRDWETSVRDGLVGEDYRDQARIVLEAAKAAEMQASDA